MTNNQMTPTLSLPALLGQLRRRWGRVLLVALPLVLFGMYVALTAPEEFITETRILPEFQAKSAAGLKRFSALAELAGINLEGVGQTEAVRPDLYPDILTSTPFVLALLRQPVSDRAGQTYPTLLARLTAPATTWFGAEDPKPTDFAALLRAVPGQPLPLSKTQAGFLKDLKKRVVAEIDKQSGILVLKVKMPDPLVAAQVAQYATRYLSEYVIGYRTDKARQDLGFLAARQAESKRRYESALMAYSQYRDRNKYVVTQTAMLDEKQLESALGVSRELYNNLTLQYEQARLRVQEATPVMKVLEPPTVPVTRSEPARTTLVLGYTLAGLVLGVAWVLLPVLDWKRLAGL
jgi:uncharacterized protein involved in exopolysaccharide biosynthesis